MTHSSPQFFKPDQWDDFTLVHKKIRAKVALALKFEAVVLAVLTLDLLVQVMLTLLPSLFHQHSNLLHPQFRWGEPGSFEIKNSVIDNFDEFVATACRWIKFKIFPRIEKSYNEGDSDEFGEGTVNVQDYAVNAIRAWGEVFCGFGAYSIQEVFFQAGGSCYLVSPGQTDLS